MNMREIPFNVLEKLYTTEAEVNFINFEHRKLQLFNAAFLKLQRSLGEEKEISFWPDTLLSLKKLRFELVALPIPPSIIITSTLLKHLEKTQNFCKSSFPECEVFLGELISKLEDLKEHENYFLEWLKENCISNSCVCLPSPRHLMLVDMVFKDQKCSVFRDNELVAPGVLKQSCHFDHIYFCGSIKLFSENQYRNFEYVWRSPRAPKLSFLSYAWINDDFKPYPSFDTGSNMVPLHIQKKVIGERLPEEGLEEENENLLRINIGDIDFSPVELVSSASNYSGGYYDFLCDCKMLLLEDGTVIYKELEGRSRIVDTNQGLGIVSIKNTKLAPGDALIVRTGGSGDSVAAVADMLFKEQAGKIRGMQERWKSAFREKMNDFLSINQVVKKLEHLGAPTSNEINVRNWQREETIKPKNKDDFVAIMKFSGLEEFVEEYWENAKLIFQMHIKAGKEISKLLLSRITETKIGELDRFGRTDINIEGLSGTLAIVKVDVVVSETYAVPYSKVDKLVSADGGM